MSGWLYAFDERALNDKSNRLRRVIDESDRDEWRLFWQESGAAITNWGAPERLSAIVLPEPHSKERDQVLRVAAHASSLKRAELWEKHWHVHYPELSDEEAGFEVSESAAYEAIGDEIFTVGSVPDALGFLNEYPNITTNWVSAKSVAQLWRLEQDEGFLATAGATLFARGTPLGHDLLAVRGMLEYCAQREAALYLWDPGT